MITIMEVWYLKPGLEDKALEIMQTYDDMVEPPAHDHPGWTGHGQFYQNAERPTEVFMIYPWQSREMHDSLAAAEEPMLQDFYREYCSRPREILYYEELAVTHED